jgi:hypothetical protein
LAKIKKYLDKKSRILFFNSYILPINKFIIWDYITKAEPV